MRFLEKRIMLLTVALLTLAATAAAYEEVEDLVDLLATGKQFIAVVDGRRNFSENYRSSEKILWQGAKGEVGAFLTNERLLAVSIYSGQWNYRFLKVNEKKSTPEILLAAHLVIMLTDERILAFGSQTGGFFQTRMPIGESVIAKDAEGRVAALITPSRAFGFSSYRRGEAELRFRRQEVLVSLKTTYNKITLQTSERLITLDAEDAVWREFDLK